MAWRRPGDKSLSETMMASLLTHMYASQWVNPRSAKYVTGDGIGHYDKWRRNVIGHVDLAAITGTTTPVPCLYIKSLQRICWSGTGKFNLRVAELQIHFRDIYFVTECQESSFNNDCPFEFNHDDVITWKHISTLLAGESTGHWWIPLTKASDAELWCFLWPVPEQTFEQTLETTVIWDAIALIITSLQWCPIRNQWRAKKPRWKHTTLCISAVWQLVD